jgi:hypothetical protein
LDDLRRRAFQLATFLGISAPEIEKRDQIICGAVASYFDMGKALNQNSSHHRNNNHENN